MATPVSNVIGLSGDPRIDGLAQGSRWQPSPGSNVITYSLSLNDTPNGSWSVGLEPGVRNALTAWSNVANITFVEQGSGTVFTTSTADIAITPTGDELQQALGAVGLGVFPSGALADAFIAASGYSRSEYPRPEGDVFIDNASPIFSNGTLPGTAGLAVLLHEIGHALGLKHTNDDGANGRPTFAALGLSSQENERYTVMALGVAGPLDATANHAGTPMPLDILAIQRIYGANMSFHTGNDNYEMHFFGDTPASKRTIWDAGGSDTLFASQSAGSVTIDLRPGSIMDVPGGGVIAIAYGTTIENATGSTSSDTIIGNDANNVLRDGGGTDVLRGGVGDDTYILTPLMGGATTPSAVVELAGEGIDTIVVSADGYVLPSNVENLTLSEDFARSASGNQLANVILGNRSDNLLRGEAGDDFLDGAASADTLIGGRGNDTYVVDMTNVPTSGTMLQMRSAPGNGFVDGTVTVTPENGTFAFTLLDDRPDGRIDGLRMDYSDGTNDFHVIYSFANASRFNFTMRTGAFGASELYGSSNAASLQVTSFAVYGNGKTYTSAIGPFNIYNLSFAFDSSGAPVLLTLHSDFEFSGDSKPPTISGTLDYNYATALPQRLDAVIEDPNEGIDTIRSSVSYILPDNVENLVLTGTGTLSGTGNALTNSISAVGGDNRLDGGAGADSMAGGAGNDTYIVDNAGDAVGELADEGTDLVLASVSYGLAANVENLGLTGTAAIDGSGNALANVLTGNAAANVLDGRGGDDVVRGAAGDDRLIYSGGFDRFDGGSGVDTADFGALDSALWVALASGAYTTDGPSVTAGGWRALATLTGIENITGSRFDDYLAGDEGANVLRGGAGGDGMDAGGGNDVLEGGAGDDRLAGDAGLDVARYSGARSAYTISKEGAAYRVSGIEGTDTLTGIERVRFADGEVKLGGPAVDVDGDRTGDVLWRHAGGEALSWRMSVAQAQSSSHGIVPPGWRIVEDGGDYNGDGRSDVLWRESGGAVATWQMNGGQFTVNTAFPSVPASWSIVDARGDYDGDGRSDVLWRDADGTIATWRMNGGQFGVSVFPTVPMSWSVIAAHGDYNGDGRGDMLWRDADGTVAIWQMNGASFSVITGYPVVPAGWSIVDASGDYNGDGRSDILWRNTDGAMATWQMNGAQVAISAAYPTVSTSWTIVDSHGDYNGDGRSDILWRDADGAVATWLMTGAQFTVSTAYPVVPTSWSIVEGHADYGGDGRSDILWRNSDGQVVTWQMNGAALETVHFLGPIGAGWSAVGEAGATLNGSAAADTLIGTVNADTLWGRGGADHLSGGAGADRFVFDTAANGDVDTISDFEPGADSLVLNELIFPVGAAGPLAAGRFVAEAGASAHDADDFILYNTSTGAVSYDADGAGAGAAMVFAILSNRALLSAADVDLGVL
jgi:Ca2+-binding RTX toxin-like protein